VHDVLLVNFIFLRLSLLKSAFAGEKIGLPVHVPVGQIGFSRMIVECKESRVGKVPITVPSNVTLTMEGQNLKVKGPLGELAITYPREVVIEKLESGQLKVRKAVETKRANQMHGLFRYSTHYSKWKSAE